METKVKYVKCPKCEINYIKEGEECCDVCKGDNPLPYGGHHNTIVNPRLLFPSLFAPEYHPEYLSKSIILPYWEVEKQFDIKIKGFGRGINVTQSKIVLISSVDINKTNFVYHDHWTEDGDYIFSGEGKYGDQQMSKGNWAIKNAKYAGKEIHLFIKFSSQEYYYQGKFSLVDVAYEDDKDANGNPRKEYKFRLRKLK